MPAAREKPYLLILKHFEDCVSLMEGAVHMKGRTASWTDEVIKHRRYQLMDAGTMVRRMSLKPRERDEALARLNKLKVRVNTLLTTNGFATMNKRWFGTVLRRVAQQ